MPRMVHAAFVRSPHAYARIRSVDKTAALAVPGALAVLAGADCVANGLKPIQGRRALAEGIEGRPDQQSRFVARSIFASRPTMLEQDFNSLDAQYDASQAYLIGLDARPAKRLG